MKSLASLGVSMPETMKPSTGSGGKVMGTLTTPVRRPASFSRLQSVRALRERALVKRMP
jgi:hypothetical protein